jgi:hypothetical protein
MSRSWTGYEPLDYSEECHCGVWSWEDAFAIGVILVVAAVVIAWGVLAGNH